MTLLSTLGFQPQQRAWMHAPPCLSTQEMTLIIPVKDNPAGVSRLLSAFLRTHPPALYPREIIIVDNNSTPPLTLSPAISADGLPITLLRCARPGPACARNLGIQHACTEWVVFTDSDCLPSSTFLTGYLAAMNGAVGYAGAVQAWGTDPWSRYYESQAILMPPPAVEDGIARPEYLVTANALAWKPALEAIGGFNETIEIAAGEDIDLGFRLREIGTLAYAPTACVYHDFKAGLLSFMRRFMRYGKGNRRIASLYSLDLTPQVFSAKHPSSLNWLLARLQYLCLTWGYRKSSNPTKPA